jgi:hypothetical protein
VHAEHHSRVAAEFESSAEPALHWLSASGTSNEAEYITSLQYAKGLKPRGSRQWDGRSPCQRCGKAEVSHDSGQGSMLRRKMPPSQS